MTTPVAPAPVHLGIAAGPGVGEAQVKAAAGLPDSGATVPFIARYRKEATAPGLAGHERRRPR